MHKIMNILLVFLCLVGCSNGKPEDNQAQDDSTIVEKSVLSTIKSNKIYEDKQIVVSINECQVGFTEENHGSFSLNLTIENKSNHKVDIYADTVLINDIVVENFNLFSESIDAKKSLNYSWLFEDYMYERNNFTTIGSISFKLIKYETIQGEIQASRTDMIRIETDHADYIQKINDEGKVLVDEKGFKVVAQEAELTGESEKEYYCWFYLENMSDVDAAFQIEKMSVNGYVIKDKSLPRYLVPKNSKGYYSLLFINDDIVNYKLEPIDRMYVEIAVLEDLDAHFYGKELVKNQSFGIHYNE